MDINHPLYPVLKDYYINLGCIEPMSLRRISKTDINNSLLFQYIEDTCGIDKNDSSFIYFKLCYLMCDIIYFANNKTKKWINFNDGGKDLESTNLYCHFTNNYLFQFSRYLGDLNYRESANILVCYIGKYKFIYYKDSYFSGSCLYVFE
jgi:hypothetical protein